ncbi:MAG: hypothetical protein RIC85_03880 [Gammaproteobacteria bacterium]
MKSFKEASGKSKFILAPKFTVIHHPVRKEFGLTCNDYTVMDSIHNLSHRPDHPWCTESKSKIGEFVGMSERQVFRAIQKGEELGLIEKHERGDLRSTDKWINSVVLYKSKTGQDDAKS